MTIEVKDLSQGGLESTFIVNFKFIEEPQESSEDSASDSDLEKAEEQARESEERIFTLLRDALKLRNRQDEEEEPLEIEATLREVDMRGTAYLDFSPSIVAVPNDWERLWSLE